MDISTPRTVLVVGDWFIDEYWFISQHHSEVSSHCGPIHYRVVSEPTHAVRDLCGAGLTARVLYELRKYQLTNNILDIIIDELNKEKLEKTSEEQSALENKIKRLSNLRRQWVKLQEHWEKDNSENPQERTLQEVFEEIDVEKEDKKN